MSVYRMLSAYFHVMFSLFTVSRILLIKSTCRVSHACQHCTLFMANDSHMFSFAENWKIIYVVVPFSFNWNILTIDSIHHCYCEDNKYSHDNNHKWKIHIILSRKLIWHYAIFDSEWQIGFPWSPHQYLVTMLQFRNILDLEHLLCYSLAFYKVA